MTLTGFALTSVISLFFSLIFSTIIFQRKTWYQIYISLSFCLLSVTTFSLCIGHFFAWYEWMIRLFMISFAFIIPSLFGFVLAGIVILFYPAKTKWISISYGVILLAFGVFFSQQVFLRDMSDLTTTQDILALSWLSENISVYFWLSNVLSVLFILSSLFLWIRRAGNAYLWFSISGFFFYIVDHLAGQERVNPWMFSVWLLVFLFLMWQGTKKLLNLEKPMNNSDTAQYRSQ
jgi:hypothetical protein